MGKLSKARQAKKARRELRRPKFDMNLLPEDISVRFHLINAGGARKITVAELYYNASGQPITTGHSICSPMDKYDHGRGNTIALGRAIRTWWEHEKEMTRITERTAAATPQRFPDTLYDPSADVEEAHANLGVDRHVMDPHAERRGRQTFTRF